MKLKHTEINLPEQVDLHRRVILAMGLMSCTPALTGVSAVAQLISASGLPGNGPVELKLHHADLYSPHQLAG